MNLTELLALPVIQLNAARRLGVVSGFLADERLRRVSHWVVLNEDTYIENVLPWQKATMGSEGVFCTAGLQPLPRDKRPIPLHTAVYDSDGRAWGMMEEIEVDETGRTVALRVGENRIDPGGVFCYGELVILRGKRRLRREREQRQEVQIEKHMQAVQKAPVSEEEGAPTWRVIERPQERETAPTEETEGSVYRVRGDYDFLVGRRLVADLVQAGRLVAKQGQVIDRSLIQAAREWGLLVALTALSRG